MHETSLPSAKGSNEFTSELKSYFKRDQAGGPHAGVMYVEFLKLVSSHMKPRSYLEIGTASGTSLQQFECDALCIDPALKITQDVFLNREKTFFPNDLRRLFC